MRIFVKPHSIQVETVPVNELEINVTKCKFEFSKEITDDFTKEAYFTLDGKTYKQIIFDNKCDIPSEVLVKEGTIEIGVVAFNDEKRYNPTPQYITSWKGSLKQADNSEPVTPSEVEQCEREIQQAIIDLQNVDTIRGADGRGIVDIIKTGTEGLVDTYTIFYTDDTTSTYEVTNGATGSGGSVDIDNSTITTNANDEIQTVAMIDSNTGNPDKFWTGTAEEYEAIITKDTNTFYYITDDDTVLLSDVQVGGTSIVSDGIANIITKTAYNSSTNKIATESDLPDISGKQDTIDSSHKLSSDLVDDTNKTNKFVTASEKTTWNNKSDFSGNYNDLSNKPTIPDELKDLSDDSTHRLVTDTEKTTWNGKSVVSGTNDGTNWSTITIDGTTKNIPSGGGGGGTATDVQINGTSIVSNNTANILTNTAYNSSSNKIATMSD